MINPKMMKPVTAIISAVRPLFFAIVGGLIAGCVQRCNKNEPVNLVITNQHYESQIKNLEQKQDSLSNVLPSVVESLKYLSRRFPETDTGSKDR